MDNRQEMTHYRCRRVENELLLIPSSPSDIVWLFLTLLWFNTYSVLEAEQHDLQLTDGGAVKVQLQLELRQRVGDDFPVSHADEVSQTDHEGGDVLRLQPYFLRALEMTARSQVYMMLLLIPSTPSFLMFFPHHLPV